MKKIFNIFKSLHAMAFLIFLLMLPISAFLLVQYMSQTRHRGELEEFAKFSIPELAIERKFSLSGANTDDEIVAGEPTRQVYEAARYAHGYAFTVFTLDKLRYQVSLKHKNPKIISKWNRLIELSLIDIEEREWALFKFKNIPVLGPIYSQPEKLNCIALLKAGKSCIP